MSEPVHHSVVKEYCDKEMAAFDALPPSLQSYIKNSRYGIPAVQVLELCRKVGEKHTLAVLANATRREDENSPYE